jgi:hypothetical protein
MLKGVQDVDARDKRGHDDGNVVPLISVRLDTHRKRAQYQRIVDV